MERRASRIVKAVVVLVGVVMAVLMLVCMLVCVTTYVANYLRRMVMAMNDEAASAAGTEEEGETESAGNIHNGGADQRGLDKAAIEKLPMVVYHHYQQQQHVQKKAEEAAAAAGEGEDGAGGGVRTVGLDCGVCLADFQEMELLRMLPACQHCFHPSCIEKWLSSHSTCPLCRHSLLPTSLQLSTIHVHIHTIDGPLMAASPPRLARA